MENKSTLHDSTIMTIKNEKDKKETITEIFDNIENKIKILREDKTIKGVGIVFFTTTEDKNNKQNLYTHAQCLTALDLPELLLFVDALNESSKKTMIGVKDALKNSLGTG